jgi:hypothetical protein
MKSVVIILAVIFSQSIAAQCQIIWNAASNLNTSASGNDHPRVVMDAAGNPLVLWEHSNRAMFSRWNGTAFTTPVMLNPMTMTIAGDYWMGPDIASHGDTVYVVFKQTPEADTSSHIYLVRSFDGGINFSAPFRVDWTDDIITRFPTVVADDSGNPMVAYMKFDASFMNAQWVVVKSTDYGSTFSPSVLASGWSSATSTVCDCCPGSIVSSGNTVAVSYRDNNSDVRDIWTGISTDGGSTFTQGVGIDQGNWMISMCPSSGPDAVIFNDTLYAVYMSGSSSSTWVWFSKTSLLPVSSSFGQPITGALTGMTFQNYPRIDRYGNAMAMVWKQYVNSSDQLAILFTNNIANGFPAQYDTVDLANVTTTDVAISNGTICAVWEDESSGTIKYRRGTFNPVVTSVNESVNGNDFEIYPNPARNKFTVCDLRSTISKIEIYDVLGNRVFNRKSEAGSRKQIIDTSQLSRGIYLCKVTGENNLGRTKKIIIE